ncbi:unnamed protein product [Cuscuta campestris]|uniref:Uncharacterized protein n=1 Tax=Cuscuta campestris TaxID=132261 RepID=A0A484KDH4_9ASTE|nr:unnamed protein product [Cuscuta campestris]
MDTVSSLNLQREYLGVQAGPEIILDVVPLLVPAAASTVVLKVIGPVIVKPVTGRISAIGAEKEVTLKRNVQIVLKSSSVEGVTQEHRIDLGLLAMVGGIAEVIAQDAAIAGQGQDHLWRGGKLSMSGGRPPAEARQGAEAQQGAEPGAHLRPEVLDLRPKHRNATRPLLRLRPAPLAAAAAGERVLLLPQRGQEPVQTMVGTLGALQMGEEV